MFLLLGISSECLKWTQIKNGIINRIFFSLLSSPYGSSTHQPHHLTHHHHMSSAVQVDAQLPLQLSSSPTDESTITVLDGPGHGELKKIYSQHHDHNNNGHIYQNLTPIHSNHVKSETHSPIDGTNKIMSPVDCKNSDSAVPHLPSNELNVNGDMSSERPRCWTKI